MKPRIFVSSTFYDLKFIREDLSNFIKAHDFEPIMFEDGDIGYTPGKELDTSCYDTMKNADMVLLIIGGEYGTAATGQVKDNFNEYISITRNEFREAAKIGVPIFVFIESNVYTEYGVYEVNIENIEKKGIKIEFKATKNINVFRFIKEIRSISDKPIQEFRRSAEIKSFLSKQWADMFKNYLAILRNDKEKAVLQNTVSDMESLIKQMRIMIDAVGKKILSDDDAKQYNNIKREQNIVEAERITQTIVDGIKVFVPDLRERRENVVTLLNTINNAWSMVSEVKTTDEHDEDEKREGIIEHLANGLFSKEFRPIEISFVLVKSIPDIVNSLKIQEIEKYVINRLMMTRNYRMIFKQDTDKSIDTLRSTEE